jgi:hypothetical protein
VVTYMFSLDQLDDDSLHDRAVARPEQRRMPQRSFNEA